MAIECCPFCNAPARRIGPSDGALSSESVRLSISLEVIPEIKLGVYGAVERGPACIGNLDIFVDPGTLDFSISLFGIERGRGNLTNPSTSGAHEIRCDMEITQELQLIGNSSSQSHATLMTGLPPVEDEDDQT